MKLFLWLGTCIAVVNAVKSSASRPPPFGLLVRDRSINTHAATWFYHHAVANYDNGLYDRDLADLDERDSMDNFVARAWYDNSGEGIEKHTDKDEAGKLVLGIKAPGKSTTTLAGKRSRAARMQEERVLHEDKLAKRMVFKQKVQEKEAKLKPSEEESYTRHREMKETLEKQHRELAENKTRLESRRPLTPEKISTNRKKTGFLCS